jgi:hypothetical protein
VLKHGSHQQQAGSVICFAIKMSASAPLKVAFMCVCPAAKAIWKLDDPAVLAAERAERQAAAAEAARRKVLNALDKKVGVLVLLCSVRLALG